MVTEVERRRTLPRARVIVRVSPHVFPRRQAGMKTHFRSEHHAMAPGGGRAAIRAHQMGRDVYFFTFQDLISALQSVSKRLITRLWVHKEEISNDFANLRLPGERLSVTDSPSRFCALSRPLATERRWHSSQTLPTPTQHLGTSHSLAHTHPHALQGRAVYRLLSVHMPSVVFLA